MIERIAFRKENEMKNLNEPSHIATRYISLGLYYCELSFKSDTSRAPTKEQLDLRERIMSMTNTQIFELARIAKFDIPYVELDDDYFSNRNDEVDELFASNPEFIEWRRVYHIRLVSSTILTHSRSKLTGSPFPERVFNRITLKIHFPRTIDKLA